MPDFATEEVQNARFMKILVKLHSVHSFPPLPNHVPRELVVLGRARERGGGGLEAVAGLRRR